MQQIEYPGFDFQVLTTHQDSAARCGLLTTPHGQVKTPEFIFCATKAAIKGGIPAPLLYEMDAQIILSNTYHLMLQPGSELIERFGKLHKFMNWQKPMLTDSGGFQVFSMGHGGVADEIKGRKRLTTGKSLLKITEEGAEFRSFINGQKYLLSPESSMLIQKQLGADLIVAFDECTAFHNNREYTERSMYRTHRWAARSLAAFNQSHDGTQSIYGVIQGGIYEDLREISCHAIGEMPFFGLAIGGSLGSNKQEMHHIVAYSMAEIRKAAPLRPVHLLGIGDIEDIIWGVEQGIDTFDCVSPTRMARHGAALLWQPKQRGLEKNKIDITKSQFRNNQEPIDSLCPCYTCRNFTTGYLHHLFKAGEMLGLSLLTLHNIHFMIRFMKAVRTALQENHWQEFKNSWL